MPQLPVGRDSSIKSAFISWGDPITDPAANTGEVHFDVVVSEDHELTVEVTEHSVEQGANIADHVRPNVNRLALECFISNTPIFSKDADIIPVTLNLDPPGDGSFLAGGTSAILDKGLQALGLARGFPQSITVSVLGFNGDIDYVKNTLNILDALRLTATLVTVTTPRAFYSNMILESVRMRRDASTGTSAFFSLQLRQIRIVSSSIVDAPLPKFIDPTPMGDKGKKDTKVADAPKESGLTFLGKALGVIQGTHLTGIPGGT